MSEFEHIGQFDPAYYRIHGLARDPFAAPADPTLFYRGAHRSQRLHLLQHLIPHTETMLLVIGDRGAGKTTLLKRLVAGAAEDWSLCTITGNAMLGADQLAVELAQCIGVSASGMTHQELLNSLRQRMSGRPGGASTTVLLVDDAHELPPGALQTLSALAAKGAGPRVVLFADPQIETMLASAQLGQVQANIGQRLDLPALSPGETREYLELKLNAAGLSGAFPFSAAQLKRIHRASSGIPARIDSSARKELAEHEITEVPELDIPDMPLAERLRSMALLVGIVAAALVLTVFMAGDAIKQLISDSDNQAVETQPDTGKTASARNESAMPERVESLPLPAKPEPASSDTVLPPPRKPALIAPREGVANTNPAPAPSQVRETGAPQAELARPAASNPAQPAIPSPVPAPAARPGHSTPREVTPRAVPPAPKPVTPKPASSKHVPATQKKPLSASQKWLAAQNPEHYTLQLMGSHSEKAVNQYMLRHNLKHKAVYLRTFHRGKYWYIVLYGDFPDREQAKAAITRLPVAMRASRPWARRIGDIEGAPR